MERGYLNIIIENYFCFLILVDVFIFRGKKRVYCLKGFLNVYKFGCFYSGENVIIKY